MLWGWEGVGAGAEIRAGDVTSLMPVLGGSARRAVAEVAPQLLNPKSREEEEQQWPGAGARGEF